MRRMRMVDRLLAKVGLQRIPKASPFIERVRELDANRDDKQ